MTQQDREATAEYIARELFLQLVKLDNWKLIEPNAQNGERNFHLKLADGIRFSVDVGWRTKDRVELTPLFYFWDEAAQRPKPYYPSDYSDCPKCPSITCDPNRPIEDIARNVMRRLVTPAEKARVYLAERAEMNNEAARRQRGTLARIAEALKADLEPNRSGRGHHDTIRYYTKDFGSIGIKYAYGDRVTLDDLSVHIDVAIAMFRAGVAKLEELEATVETAA